MARGTAGERGTAMTAWLALGSWMSEHMVAVVPTCVAFSLVWPQVLSPVKPLVPTLFAALTFLNSLDNDLGSMRRTLRNPIPLAAILLTMHVALPLAAFALSSALFGASSPLVAGVVLEYVVPIGTSTVMWCGMYGGNVILSLAVLLASSLLSPFTIPATLQLLVGTTVEVDGVGMMCDMLYMVVAPALAATALNEHTRGWAGRDLAPRVSPLSKLLLPLIVATNATGIADTIRHLTLPLVGIMALMLAFAVASFAAGLVLARILHADRAETVTVSFSVGVRNVSAGAVLATRYFSAEVMFPAVICTLFQQILAAAFGRVVDRRLPLESR